MNKFCVYFIISLLSSNLIDCENELMTGESGEVSISVRNEGEQFMNESNRSHGHGEKYKDSICKPCPSLVPLYPYYNPESGGYLFTTNYALLADGKYGYKRGRTEVYIWASEGHGRKALYEFYNDVTKELLLTTDRNGGHGYEFGGIVGYIYTQPKSETVAIGHLKNHRTKVNIYTPNLSYQPPDGTSNKYKKELELVGILGYGCPPLPV